MIEETEGPVLIVDGRGKGISSVWAKRDMHQIVTLYLTEDVDGMPRPDDERIGLAIDEWEQLAHWIIDRLLKEATSCS